MPDGDGAYRIDALDGGEIYRYRDILDAARGSRAMADRIFAQLDWQHPDTVYQEEMALLEEDWEAAPGSLPVSELAEEAAAYAECRLRERGIEGERLARAMESDKASIAALIEGAEAIEDELVADAEIVERMAPREAAALAREMNEDAAMGRGEDRARGGEWRVGSIAVGKTSGIPFVVLDVDERGMLRLGADLSAHDPAAFERAGEVDADVAVRFREGLSDGRALEYALAEAVGDPSIAPGRIEDIARARARAEAIEREAPRPATATPGGDGWKVGDIAVGRTSGVAFVVLDVDERGMLLVGADGQPCDPAAFERAGEVDAATLAAIRAGTVTEAEMQGALLSARREAEIIRGAEEDFGDYAAERAATRAPSKRPALGPVAAGQIDFERSRWRRDEPGGWVYEAFLLGQRPGEEPWAEARVEETRPGVFAPALFAGEDAVALPLPGPAQGYGTLAAARRAAMVQLEAAAGILDGSLRARAQDPVAEDPYPAQWEAAMEDRYGTALQMLDRHGFDPSMEYVRFDEAGAWEALYYNPDGNEGRGQIVAASGSIADALAEGAAALSGCESRAADAISDWPAAMDAALSAFALDRAGWTAHPESDHAAILAAARDHMARLFPGDLDTERSGIREEDPGRAYQLTAVAWGDAEGERAMAADVVLDGAEAAWIVETHFENGEPGEAVVRSGPFNSFEDARASAYGQFVLSGKFRPSDIVGQGRIFAATEEMGRRAASAATALLAQKADEDPHYLALYPPSVLLGDGWGWDVRRGELLAPDGEAVIEVLPERKEVRYRGEPVPGATTWTADNDDVRLALEAFAAREEDLPCDVAGDLTWDEIIRDVSKDLAKYDGLQAPRIEGAFQFASERERYERDLDGLFKAAERGEEVSPLDTIYVCPTPAILVALGMEQRPVHLSKSHALRIIAPKDEAKHRHGLSRADLLALPELMAAPAFITDALETAMRQDAVVMVMAETDADGLPLMAAIRPNDKSVYELETLDVNRLMSVYGRNNVKGFLESAVEQGKLLFVDKEKTEELEAASQLQLLKSAAGLPSESSIAQEAGKEMSGGPEAPPRLLSAVAGLPMNTVIRQSGVIERAEGRRSPADEAVAPSPPPGEGGAPMERQGRRVTYHVGHATDYQARPASAAPASPAADRREARAAAEALKKDLPGPQMQRRQ